MASSITADIYEGKDVVLRDYLMRVGQQMGIPIMQRDDARDAPIRRVEPSTSYYDESQQKAEERIAWLRSLSPAEVAEEAHRAYTEALDGWKERRAEREALRARYEAMLAQVEEWQPDPLIEGTKENAIRHLRESIKFDCGSGEWDKEPVEKEPREWLRAELDEAARSIQYAMTERAEEIARTNECNRYIDAFYASLPESA